MLPLALVLPPLVTVTFAPTPLPQALERISAAAGERLVCAKALNDETLLARLKDADEARVRGEIAAAFDARWEPTEGGWLLKPDPAAARRRAAATEAAREKALKAAMSELAERLDDAKKATSKDEEAPTPGGLATARLIVAVGLRTLLDMAPNERIVYAENPTPMQRSFPVGSQGALDAFRRASTTPISRFRLIVRFDTDEERYAFDLEALDASGATIDGGQDALAPQTDEAETMTFDKLPGEKPLVVPKEAQEYADLMGSRQRASRGATFDRWRPILSDPVAHEPTAWYPGAALVAAAEARDENLVGTLGETCYARYGRPRNDETPSGLLKGFARLLTRKGGWILVRSDDHVPRASRAEARDLIARALAQNGLDIDAAADWQARHPTSYPALGWLGTHLGALLTGSAATLGGEGIDFWSRISPSLRRDLRQGARVSITALPPDAQRAIREDVYWNDLVEGPPVPEPNEDVPYRRLEITERLPRGLASGTVSLDVASEPVMAAWTQANGEPVFRARMTAEQFGMLQFRWERSHSDPGYDRFRMGVARTYTLRFDFGRYDLRYAKTMVETIYDPEGTPVERPPEEYLKRAAEAKRKAQETPDEEP